jgi:glycosyltransferase involved in cell wall biosynthesis
MKILEYMALGKPVVAPRQENIREIVREGEEAILFTPGDAASFAAALERLAENPAERLRFGANARMAVHNRSYLWRANAARVVAGCQALRDQIAETPARGENCEPVPAPSRIGGES